MELRSGSLNFPNQHKLSCLMEKTFPDIIGHWELVDHWGENMIPCGYTIFGVYRDKDKYVLCKFPEIGSAEMSFVNPIFVHTGWKYKP